MGDAERVIGLQHEILESNDSRRPNSKLYEHAMSRIVCPSGTKQHGFRADDYIRHPLPETASAPKYLSSQIGKRTNPP